MSLHIPVLAKTSIDYLITNPNGIYIDATFGRGGHSKLILERLNKDGLLIAIDKDLTAIRTAKDLQNNHKNNFNFFHGSFATLGTCLDSFNINNIDGILFDFGVSSPQLDNPQRGFSFINDGPLDMRMDQESELPTAFDWLNKVNFQDLSNILFQYGDEKYSRKIARAILEIRDKGELKNSTIFLAELIKKFHPRWPKNIHPATKSFQAIRIFINNELNDIKKALPLALKYLKSNGRIVCISFHSLEDRIVKNFIKDNLNPCRHIPKEVPVLAKDMEPTIKVVNKGKNIKADSKEVEDNIRSRSAVMRVIEKL